MKKLLMSTALLCTLVSGCSNATNEDVLNDKTSVVVDETVSVETKAQYTLKLDEIDESLADLQGLHDEGTTLSMQKAADETYKRWDEALNEIYKELEQQLSTEDMAELKEAQTNWVSAREKTAKDESLEFEGGTMESLAYVNALARITKERCYELVESYMN